VRAFFDTNVIVYAHDKAERGKRVRAMDLMETHSRANTLVVSTQVLVESYNALQRAALLSPAHALDIVESLVDEHVVATDAELVLRGIRLSQRYRLSHWDGLVLQAALDAGCGVVFTEDLQSGQRFDGVEIVNPFADTAHAPRARYAAKAAPAKRRKTR
jgi:predicted nucleic acid-binding protein